MLKPSSSFEIDGRLHFLFADVDAYDPETGAYLSRSRGRSSKAQKWFLFFADSMDREGNYRPYKEWRHTFRAWTLTEAVDHANEKLAQLVAQGKAACSRWSAFAKKYQPVSTETAGKKGAKDG